MVTPTDNGWELWKTHVLSELKRQQDDFKDLKLEIHNLGEQMVKLRIDIAGLKARAAVWGGIASVVVLVLIKIAGKITF